MLKLKIFTFEFSEQRNGFDDQKLQDFLEGKDVVDYGEHFFIHNKLPYLTITLSYREQSRHVQKQYDRKEDPSKELSQAEKIAYDALRSWRAVRASKEGIPPFMVVHNKQLVQMIVSGIKTKEELARIRGLGEAKVKLYGEDMLKILQEHMRASVASPQTDA